MSYFDSSKNWFILLPSGIENGDFAAAELSQSLGLLGVARGEKSVPFPVADAGTDPDNENQALILLNLGAHPSHDPGFSWRAADERIEIYGDSPQGLIRGIYDFLEALGFSWKKPEKKHGKKQVSFSVESIPDFQIEGRYQLARSKSREVGIKDPIALRRFQIDTQDLTANGDDWVLWALSHKVDALVLASKGAAFSALKERLLHRKIRFLNSAKRFGLRLEDASISISSLVPRRLFLFKKDLFRMYEGRRRADFNFCPTNPETIELLKREARRFYRQRPWAQVFHLWPDEGRGGVWCSCPSCRAFSPAEQALIAANATADALAEIESDAQVSYIKSEDDTLGIKPRASLMPLSRGLWKSQVGK